MRGASDGKSVADAPVSAVLLERGGYRARLAQTAQDLLQAQQLRGRCFRAEVRDQDPYDAVCLHVLIESQPSGDLVGCFRLMVLESGQAIAQSYSAQFYDLSRLSKFPERMMELGRFCIDPGVQDADILRLAWAAVTDMVDQQSVALLFGCSSFAGTTPETYTEAFALLQRRHLAPDRWRPGHAARETRCFDALLHDRAEGQKPDLKLAQAQLPPLLRSYLTMGGWVSDHVVIDADLNTCHVFTGLEVKAIPATRKRLLRSAAQQS